MNLYVCWGTFPVPWPRRSASWRPGAHPCKRAYDALKEAGHSPAVIKTYGFASLPDITTGRNEVKRLTGESFVPVLVLDDGEVIKDSSNIIAWARAHPASMGAETMSTRRDRAERQVGAEDAGFIPALRFNLLTPLFDLVAAVAVRDRAIKRRVLAHAAIAGGEDVLDVGCGTGTLAVAAAQTAPNVKVTGLDADASILARAREKATAAGLEIAFDEGRSTALPYPDASFDVVLSTLFFHHLPDDGKRRTAAELVRVLRPGARLVVADLGRPQDPLMRTAVLMTVQLLDGFATTALNVRGELPEVLGAAGLRSVTLRDRMRTPTGSYEVMTAAR